MARRLAWPCGVTHGLDFTLRAAYTPAAMPTRPTPVQPPGRKADIWLIADGQPGNETQIQGLAERLRAAGANVAIKQARANRLHMLGALLLGASGRSLDRARSDALAPPWPDLVIGTGRRSGPWARYVKARSGGMTAAALFGQKGANLMTGLDLGVVLAHWRFPPHPRRETILLPPTGATPVRLAAASAALPGLLDPAAGPWLLLVVGGRCFDHALTPADAADVACRAARAAEHAGGQLAIVASRRTGDAAEAAIRMAAPQARLFSWRDAPNPFLALLDQADAAIVTGDSESMIAEAVAAGLPTYVSAVRRRWSLRMAAERGAARMHRLGGPLAWAIEWLWAVGALLPPRDLTAMAAGLESAGYAARFIGDAIDLNRRPPPPPDARLAARLLELAERNIAKRPTG